MGELRRFSSSGKRSYKEQKHGGGRGLSKKETCKQRGGSKFWGMKDSKSEHIRLMKAFGSGRESGQANRGLATLRSRSVGSKQGEEKF